MPELAPVTTAVGILRMCGWGGELVLQKNEGSGHGVSSNDVFSGPDAPRQPASPISDSPGLHNMPQRSTQ